MPQNPADAPLIDQQAYRFQLDLTDSIASYIRELRWAQFHALSYRGADFGRVIALHLYFRLINDPLLHAAHARMSAGEKLSEDPDAIPVGTIAYWALRQMLGRRPAVPQEKPFKTWVKRCRAYAERSWAMGLGHLHTGARPESRKDGPVLILALSRRFFDYLMPVRRALDAEVTWLIPADAAWAGQLTAQGERVVMFGEEDCQKPEGALTTPLADWHPQVLRFDTFRRILEREAPAAVMMTEGNQPDDEILARAAQTLGVRSICIQQGWSPIIHAGFRDMRFDEFCAWGPEFVRLLQPENARQHFAVTGSHRIEPTSATGSRNERAIAFFLQKNSLLITERAWNEMLDFVCWTAAAWPGRKVLVREHPAEPLTMPEQSRLATLPNIALCPPAAAPLDAMLRQTGIAVAFFSTTLIEALAYDAVPLILNITGAPHYVPDLAAMGAGIEVQDFDAARTAMVQLLKDPGPARNPAVLPRFFPCSSAEALRNIARVTTGR